MSDNLKKFSQRTISVSGLIAVYQDFTDLRSEESNKTWCYQATERLERFLNQEKIMTE